MHAHKKQCRGAINGLANQSTWGRRVGREALAGLVQTAVPAWQGGGAESDWRAEGAAAVRRAVTVSPEPRLRHLKYAGGSGLKNGALFGTYMHFPMSTAVLVLAYLAIATLRAVFIAPLMESIKAKSHAP